MNDNYNFIENKTEEEIWAEVAEGEKIQFRRDSWRGFWLTVKNRCKDDQEFHINRLERWFYTLKLCYCVLVGRTRIKVYKHFNNKNKSDLEKFYPDVVTGAEIRSRYDGYSWDATWIEVGYGYFSNWWYRIEEDGEFLY
jgi:hypothetical protein